MDWQTLRNQFMRDTGGDPPGAALEDELINAYTHHPQAVERSTEKITLAYKAGKIHSPWGALKTEVAKATDQARNPTHDQSATRAKALERARQWLRTAGIHYDRPSEIEDELFGERGILHPYRDDPTITAMLDLWHELRPLGVIVEHEHDERMARYRDQPKPEPTHKHGNLTTDELRALAAQKSQTPPAHILDPPLTT